jgi:Fur family peroxide stress response transcriptional regulator
MTRADSSLAWFDQLCRQHGLSLTVQRRTILSILLGSHGHPSADQVYAQARRRIPGLSRTTVYRVLETLVRIGAVARVAHPGSAARYDPKTHRHHHFVCVRCGSIIDLEDQRLDRIELPDLARHGLNIQDFNIHLRGVCAACSQQEPATPRVRSSRRPINRNRTKRLEHKPTLAQTRRKPS